MRVTWGKNKSDENGAPVAVSAGERCPADASQHSLAQALLQEGAISQDALNQALEIRDDTGEFLGKILVDASSISEDSLTAFLAKYCRVPHLSLLDYLIDDSLVSLIPSDVCIKHRVLPVDKLGNNLTVAMVNPLNKNALAEVQKHCADLHVKPVLCAYSHFVTIAERLFGKDGIAAVPKQNAASMEDFGFTPFDAEDGDEREIVADGALLDGEAVVTEIMSSFDEELEDDTPIGEGERSEIDTMLAAMRESMRGTYTLLARRMELFNGLTPEAVAKVFASGMTVELQPGETLYTKGDESRELYAVLRGAIELRDGDTRVGSVNSGEVVGETAWVSEAPRSVTATATETTSLITLSDEVFRDLLTKENAVQLLMNVIYILTTRIRLARDE